MIESISMYDYQLDAIKRMHNGCILCGDVGSGKSRTALAYFFQKAGGSLNPFHQINAAACISKNLFSKLIIITTARKRDTHEWEGELAVFGLNPADGPTAIDIVIDSWNNIQKYKEMQDCFFIFDEQRVVGTGAWVKSFIKIAKSNQWILLSATPGDNWSDYIPVFIANGFYKNKTAFASEHIVYSYRANYPKIDRYLNTGRLIRLRNDILVEMDFTHKIEKHHEFIYTNYDKNLYKQVLKTRQNLDGVPLESASELCYLLRKISTDPTRIDSVKDILQTHRRAIIFYNFDYELNQLLDTDWGEMSVAQWNGHKHQPIPGGDEWVYFVQYTAGAEGWNCITANCVIFYSLNYSYKIMHQAAGRIDRLNTQYTDLYYYYLTSHSSIDLAVRRALHDKKNFNESSFARRG